MNNKIVPSDSKFVLEIFVRPDYKLPFVFHMDDVTQASVNNIHQNIEILYFLEGTGYINYNNRCYTVEKGDVIVINSYVIHQIIASTRLLYSCLILDNSFCKTNDIASDNLYFTEKIQDSELNALCERVLNEYNNHGDFRNARIKCAVLNVLLHLCLNYSIPRTEKSPNMQEGFVYVRSATEYIKANLSKKITIEDIASNIGLSRYYFMRKFKKITGYTITEYINIMRCEHASELLKKGKFTVKEVALKCGFDNFSYFTNVYKKYKGVLPSEANKKVATTLQLPNPQS